MKHEANFQTTFNHWLKEVYKKTGAFELKQTKTNSLPFSDVKPHQKKALVETKWNQLVFKIPDGVFSQSPFDCFSLCMIPAYVVIKYPYFFCLIDIDDWESEEFNSIRKSLTSERAKEIATTIVSL